MLIISALLPNILSSIYIYILSQIYFPVVMWHINLLSIYISILLIWQRKSYCEIEAELLGEKAKQPSNCLTKGQQHEHTVYTSLFLPAGKIHGPMKCQWIMERNILHK